MLRTVGEEGLRLLGGRGGSQPQSRGFNGGRGILSLRGAVAAGRGGRSVPSPHDAAASGRGGRGVPFPRDAPASGREERQGGSSHASTQFRELSYRQLQADLYVISRRDGPFITIYRNKIF